ncbi:PBP2_Bug_TTT domain containing protein [uncultured Caudovirales phage]|uniref:PBP2_Bug_TTT domain containing protein n=1 Tax=uncultured Caudovirales phage TaxID=2100421 RepID=A0A6J5T247_9CAUD|nr:PBP2_Bug_TTT domain containing protein [uncultured Caudovirales phage]CAB4165800.1 PBP2_Bug_TTT domain containing protein [uncultured Caudovirales phage]CAB4186970.1 PBP2_Bug_TTT domain containing protein [uncultured Caudovirales phage]CAB4221296.1 PBP2_Bug_TTT domain containing protein [uncultured Caudovirales phage]
MKKLLLTILLLPSLALAWQPTRPITVIFPNGPGAGNEISFRFVASIVEKKTKTTFASEYRPGADGNIAMNHFATVPADGYTIAVPACQSNWVTADVWYSNMLKYDVNSFEPVANIARSPLTFWANPKSNINTPKELADAIKNSTRPIAIAIGGGGHRLAVEYLTESLGVPSSRIEAVMYKGPAQALLDVIGGHVEFGVTPVAVGWPHVQTGKLKLIGIANEYPLKGLEKAPLMKTIAPGLFIHGCWNIVLPKGTPADVQAWYHEQFVPAIRSSEAAEKFTENMMFITPAEHTPEGVRTSMAQLRQVWQPIAKKVKPE